MPNLKIVSTASEPEPVPSSRAEELPAVGGNAVCLRRTA